MDIKEKEFIELLFKGSENKLDGLIDSMKELKIEVKDIKNYNSTHYTLCPNTLEISKIKAKQIGIDSVKSYKKSQVAALIVLTSIVTSILSFLVKIIF